MEYRTFIKVMLQSLGVGVVEVELGCSQSIHNSIEDTDCKEEQRGNTCQNYEKERTKILIPQEIHLHCPAVRVPIITQRGARPTVQSFTKPISLAIFARRVNMGPSPPAPFLLT